ncbi:MAG: DUF2884 family protein [Plesiomonas sp.]
MRAKPMLAMRLVVTLSRSLLLAIVGGLMTMPAFAAETCPYTLNQNISLTPDAVVLQGKNQQLQISRDGEVSRDQQPLVLDLAAQQQAFALQQQLRQALPALDKQAHQQLQQAQQGLDQVVVRELGASSKVRAQLSSLHALLSARLDSIVVHQHGGLTVLADALPAQQQETERLVQQKLGEILQQGLQELSSRQSEGDAASQLKAMLGQVAGLRNALSAEWKNQEQGFRRLGSEACQTLGRLQQQQQKLELLLPQ